MAETAQAGAPGPGDGRARRPADDGAPGPGDRRARRPADDGAPGPGDARAARSADDEPGTEDRIRAVDGSPLTNKAIIRRQRIIEAAIDLGTEGGYEAVQMRSVAEQADVALATVYRYFESKDHLLSAAVSEWTAQLQARLARRPARGDNPTEQLVDVLRRASRGLEQRPLLAAALVRALGSPDPGVAAGAAQVRSQIKAITEPILVNMSADDVEGVVAVLSHVWNSSLLLWANRHVPISTVGNELERAARLLLAPRPGAACPQK